MQEDNIAMPPNHLGFHVIDFLSRILQLAHKDVLLCWATFQNIIWYAPTSSGNQGFLGVYGSHFDITYRLGKCKMATN